MRRSSFSAPPLLAALLLLLIPLSLQSAPQAGDGTADTTAVDTTAGERGRVRISIDERGISVEGETHPEGSTSTDWVEIRDDRDYREKGTDIVRFGESVFVARDEVVRGDLVVFAGTAIVEGKVTGNVVVIGGNMRVRSGAEIKGDAMVIGGNLDDDDDAIIRGERATINGLWAGDWSPQLDIPTGWVGVLSLVISVFIHLVLYVLVVLFLRERVLVAGEHLSTNYLKSFGVGLLATVGGFFALLLVSIPLIITLVGIPLALMLIVSWVGLFIIAGTVFTFAFGRLANSKMGLDSTSPFNNVLVGLLLLNVPAFLGVLLSFVHSPLLHPAKLFFELLSGFFYFYAMCSGLGALVTSRFGGRTLDGDEPVVTAAGPVTA